MAEFEAAKPDQTKRWRAFQESNQFKRRFGRTRFANSGNAPSADRRLSSTLQPSGRTDIQGCPPGVPRPWTDDSLLPMTPSSRATLVTVNDPTA